MTSILRFIFYFVKEILNIHMDFILHFILRKYFCEFLVKLHSGTAKTFKMHFVVKKKKKLLSLQF